MPAERVEALRRAFDATMKDPEFIAEAKRQNADPIPVVGERLQELAIQAAAASDDLVARVAALTTPKDIGQLKK